MAIQTSAALAAVLLLVSVVIAGLFVRAQNQQIAETLNTVAMTADDVDDPPPGMELALRDNAGRVEFSDGGKAGVPLLSGEPGTHEVHDRDREYQALVVDRPEGRVVAMLDLSPFRSGRARLLTALALAEAVGVAASILVVALFTRRSVRPLAQALALQRRFIADASHELRAPLTVLHTRAQLLARRVHNGDLDGAQRDADAVVDDTRVLGGIVDDLLASATMSGGKPDAARVDMAAVARSVCDSMSAYADSLGVTLRCQSDADAVVLGSETALRRALTALVDNALGHEHDGGTVQLTVRRAGQNVVIAVADDGVGIDDATMATLFNRFARGGSHTTRPDRDSYGIGLSLVREIVQAHGGDVRVSSKLGEGATFSLTLPAAPVAPPAPAPPPES